MDNICENELLIIISTNRSVSELHCSIASCERAMDLAHVCTYLIRNLRGISHDQFTNVSIGGDTARRLGDEDHCQLFPCNAHRHNVKLKNIVGDRSPSSPLPPVPPPMNASVTINKT